LISIPLQSVERISTTASKITKWRHGRSRDSLEPDSRNFQRFEAPFRAAVRPFFSHGNNRGFQTPHIICSRTNNFAATIEADGLTERGRPSTLASKSVICPASNLNPRNLVEPATIWNGLLQRASGAFQPFHMARNISGKFQKSFAC